MQLATADANNPDDDADDRRPEREEEQEAWADGIGVRVGPKAEGGSDNDEKKRAGACEQQGESDPGPRGLEIGAHEALSDDTIVWMAAGGKRWAYQVELRSSQTDSVSIDLHQQRLNGDAYCPSAILAGRGHSVFLTAIVDRALLAGGPPRWAAARLLARGKPGIGARAEVQRQACGTAGRRLKLPVDRHHRPHHRARAIETPILLQQLFLA